MARLQTLRPRIASLPSRLGSLAKAPTAPFVGSTKATPRRAGRWLQRARERLFARDPLCAECRRQNRVAVATQRDHIVPLSEGGTDDDENIQGLCDACHEAKSAREEAARARAR
jgi:5-methylcytosine-specific restriction protein A